MALNENDVKKIVEQYRSGMSTYEIAAIWGKYANWVNRILKRVGEPLRDHSDAQKAALESGRSTNPFEGKSWSEEEKDRISRQMQEYWRNLSPEERERIRQERKEQWDAMSDMERLEFMKKGHEASNRASRKGSQIEHYLKDELGRAGYHVLFHKRGAIIDRSLEVDILLTDWKVAIECSGPTHYKPIYGEERLQAQLRADERKAGLLLHAGYRLIILKCLFRKINETRKQTALAEVTKILKSIQNGEKVPDIIEVEIE